MPMLQHSVRAARSPRLPPRSARYPPTIAASRHAGKAEPVLQPRDRGHALRARCRRAAPATPACKAAARRSLSQRCRLSRLQGRQRHALTATGPATLLANEPLAEAALPSCASYDAAPRAVPTAADRARKALTATAHCNLQHLSQPPQPCFAFGGSGVLGLVLPIACAGS